jgi:hypothetical protein
MDLGSKPPVRVRGTRSFLGVEESRHVFILGHAVPGDDAEARGTKVGEGLFETLSCPRA